MWTIYSTGSLYSPMSLHCRYAHMIYLLMHNLYKFNLIKWLVAVMLDILIKCKVA